MKIDSFPQSFINFVEYMVSEKEMSYLSAIIEYCNIKDIELEDITKNIPPSIKQKISLEAKKLNLLKHEVSDKYEVLFP